MKQVANYISLFLCLLLAACGSNKNVNNSDTISLGYFENNQYVNHSLDLKLNFPKNWHIKNTDRDEKIGRNEFKTINLFYISKGNPAEKESGPEAILILSKEKNYFLTDKDITIHSQQTRQLANNKITVTDVVFTYPNFVPGIFKREILFERKGLFISLGFTFKQSEEAEVDSIIKELVI
ncbi:hypothetical protein [Spartinivicinus poritis]|uniref:Lipoprotein n=1 Tax=Spartinivicinus poritis TaxID=2994640 RepID=A0ABT5U6Z5_9GAMM|nr:hypothetical protein [Spartinivicinus sp. A2-2]MDE1462141.1 hypothetical protein [Spartinivicinus sp. A2-2]